MQDGSADRSWDAAWGALLGAAGGDAAGAVLEFTPIRGDEHVHSAMRMPGGGAHGVGPGQLTDDTELALCLAHGLATQPPPALPLDAIAEQYKKWFRSAPFDVGNTCRAAFGGGGGSLAPSAASADAGKNKPQASVAARMTQKAATNSMESQSNGALMRATPLAIWGHMLPPDQLAEHARAEARLSHPNPVCQDCNAAYCIAIAHLIRHPGDADGALSAASAWAESHAQPVVKQWLLVDSAAGDAAALDAVLIGLTRTAGFVRWGFTLAFAHLRRRSTYEAAVFDTLRRGGDPDTNGAIVGGLIGALHGASGGIPDYMKGPVLARTTSSAGGPRRPDFLQGCRLPEVAQKLFALATPSGRAESEPAQA